MSRCRNNSAGLRYLPWLEDEANNWSWRGRTARPRLGAKNRWVLQSRVNTPCWNNYNKTNDDI